MFKWASSLFGLPKNVYRSISTYLDNKLQRLSRFLEPYLEKFDWWFGSLIGNSVLSRWLRKRFSVLEGHSGIAVLPFFLLIPFLVAGPSFEFEPGDLLLAAGGIAVYAFLLWRASRLGVFASPLGTQVLFASMVFVTFLSMYWTTPDSWFEATQPVHPDIIAPFILVLLLVAWFVPRLLLDYFELIPRDIRVDRESSTPPEPPCMDEAEPKSSEPAEPLDKLLARANLLNKPDPPDPKTRYFLACLFTVPFYLPTQLLFGTAVYTLLTVPCPWLTFGFEVWYASLVFLAVWWLFLGIIRTYSHIGEANRAFVGRMIYQGGPLVVTWIVIIVALTYLYDIQYVSTVLNADWWLVMKYLLAIYLALWVSEYWTNRKLSERVLRLLRPMKEPTKSASAEIGYRASTALGDQGDHEAFYDFAPAIVASSKEFQAEQDKSTPRNVRVQIHAGVLFAVFVPKCEGCPKCNRLPKNEGCPDDDDRRAFYQKTELIDTVLRRTGTAEGDYDLGTLRRAIRDYSGLLNLVLLVVLGGIGIWMYRHDRQVIAKADMNASGNVDLQEKLFSQDNASERVILFAGSGGGTRAALYTASVLDGLRNLGALDEVVLTSGVSGGGVALAYFAANKGRLVGASASESDWNKFHENMARPFISDVLEGASEFRIATGTPLGKLLVESFERAFKDGGVATGQLSAVPHAVIWNTTLCGEAPPRGANQGKTTQLQGEYLTLKTPGDLSSADLTSSYHAGGRLIFTNLKSNTAFAGQGFTDAPRERLRYVVVRDQATELWKIAALNANFPPVFQNAGVDLTVDGEVKQRYWVTDGGAMDNRGLISLLLALRDAMKRELTDRKTNRTVVTEIPKIHIVVAEASAGGFDYSHDQGFGALGGAKAIIANGMIRELVDEVASLETALRAQTAKNKQPNADQNQGDNPPSDDTQSDNLSSDRADDSTGFESRIHYLAMPSVFRMRGGMGTHWIMHESVTFTETNPPNKDEAERFGMNRALVQRVIRNLHPQRIEDYGVPDKGTLVKELNRNLTKTETNSLWRLQQCFDNDYQGTHRESWARLIGALQTNDATAADEPR